MCNRDNFISVGYRSEVIFYYNFVWSGPLVPTGQNKRCDIMCQKQKNQKKFRLFPHLPINLNLLVICDIRHTFLFSL